MLCVFCVDCDLLHTFKALVYNDFRKVIHNLVKNEIQTGKPSMQVKKMCEFSHSSAWLHFKHSQCISSKWLQQVRSGFIKSSKLTSIFYYQVNRVCNEDLCRGKEVCIHRSNTYRPGKDLVGSAAAGKWVLFLSGHTHQ